MCLWKQPLQAPCTLVFRIHEHHDFLRVGFSKELDDYNRDLVASDCYSWIHCFQGYIRQDDKLLKESEPKDRWPVTRRAQGEVKFEVTPSSGTYSVWVDGKPMGVFQN